MNGKTRDFYDAHPRFIEKNTTFPQTALKKHRKIALTYQLDSRTPCHKLQHISTESHTDVQNMQEKTHKTWDWRQLGAKANGKTRDVCDVRAILNEKTQHSHKRDSANPVKMYTNVIQKTMQKCIQKIRRALKFRLRSKAEGLPDKENPGPRPLPGKINTNHEIGDRCEQKWTEKHETCTMPIHVRTRKHDIPINGFQQTL